MKKVVLAFVVLASFTAAKAQTAEEIVAKYTEAMGGKEAWAKINSLRYEATLTVQGAEVSVTQTVLQQKGMRTDIAVMGMTGYQIMTTTDGWNYMPFQGQSEKQAATSEEVKEAQGDLETSGNGLMFYKERGGTVDLIGKEDVDGTECFKVRLTDAGGKTNFFFIDPKTWFIVKTVAKQKANGQEMEVSTGYSNYKKQPEGITVAMTIMMPFGEMTLNKVEFNKPVDEKIFKPE
jgi:outer membrane lipoprotein-sorting protein